jgi:chromosome segregation ATPase
MKSLRNHRITLSYLFAVLAAILGAYYLFSTGVIDFKLGTQLFSGVAGLTALAFLAGLFQIERRLELVKTVREHLGRDSKGKKTKLAFAKDSLARRLVETDREGSSRLLPSELGRQLTADDVYDDLNSLLQVVRNQAPSMFTAFGIIFTFFGLIYGLEGMENISVEPGSEQLNALLSGVGVAFQSSFAGVTLSIISLLLVKWAHNDTVKACKDLRRKARRVDVESVPEAALRTLRDDTEDNRETLKKIRQTSEEQSAKLGSLSTDIREALEETLTDQVTEPLNDVRGDLRDFQEGQLDTHKNALEEVLDEFRHRFSDQLKTRFGDLKDVLERVIEWNEETQSHYEELLSSLERQIQEQREALKKREKTNEAQRALMAKSTSELDQLYERVDQTADEVRPMLEELSRTSEEIAGTGASLATANEELSESVDTFGNEVTAHEQVMEEGLERTGAEIERLGDILGNTRSSISEELVQTADKIETLAESLEAQAEHQRKEMESRRATLQSQQELVEKSTSELDSLYQRVEEGSEAMKPLVEGLKTASEEVAESGHEISQANATLSRSVDDFNEGITAHEERTQTQLQEVHQEIDRLAKTLDQANTSMRENLVQTAQQVEELLSSVEEQLDEVPAEYENLIKQINRELGRGLRQSFEEFDQQTAAIVEHLNGTHANIEATVEELNASVESVDDSVGAMNDRVESMNRGLNNMNDWGTELVKWTKKQRSDGDPPREQPSDGQAPEARSAE